jgi:flagellar biosynthesis/type III secretory pathway M-ring protein FliF/YscJ
MSVVDKDVTLYNTDDGGSLKAPITAGEVLGEVSITGDGVNYGTVKLVAASGIELSRAQYIKSQIRQTLGSTPVKIAIIVIVLLLAAYIFLVIRYRVLHARHKKALRQARARQQQPAARQSQHQEHQSAPAPDMSYFTDDTPAPKEPEADQSQAERDYFEEFFRQK